MQLVTRGVDITWYNVTVVYATDPLCSELCQLSNSRVL